MRQIADISRTKFEAGTHTAADVLVAETEASKLLESERDLERQLSEEEAQLNALMNRDAFAPLGAPSEVTPKMPEISPTKLRPLLLAHRPEIKMAEAKIDLEKSNLQLAQRAWIPDPALAVKAQRYNDTGQAVSELDAGVSFTVPWVNFRKYGAAVREGQENVGAAEQALERSENEALRLLRDQLQKVETAHHHLELFRDKIIPQAQQAYEANRLNYESGKASFLDWITSQRNLRDLEAKVTRAMAIPGARYVHIHVPCPLGWGSAPENTIKVARLAVESGLFPLFEAEHGKIVSRYTLRRPVPVDDYLKLQRRYAHLFGKKPDLETIAAIQGIAGRNIEEFGLKS